MSQTLKSWKSWLAKLRSPEAATQWANLLRGIAPIALLAVAITALVLMFMWRGQAAYKPLFGEREDVPAADVMKVLEDAGVSYRVHPQTGQVLVPDSQLGEVRMLLAAKGVVAKLPAGLELMDQKDPLGVSQFVQDVRFRRGLEGELARSILTLDAVQSARVHISVARSSSFVVSNGEKSSASVVVTLKPGRDLNDEQIAAIVKMVAGSTAGLEPERVTLVDQGGRLLSARVDLSEGYVAGQASDAARHYEETTRQNVIDLLAPVLGAENVRVSVTADVDTDRIKETHERFGDTPKITNEALREEHDSDRLAVGVPGSLSNRPVAVAENEGGGPPANTAQRNAATRQYAYDRSITQIQRSHSRLRKLNVAVVLNANAAPGGAASWSEAQLVDVERILHSGLGIDTARGDTLVVSTLAFPSRPAPAPWWQERNTIIDLGTWLGYALAALFVFFFMFRPLMKLVQQRLSLPRAAPSEVEAKVVEPAKAAPGSLGIAAPAATGSIAVNPLLADYDLPPPGSPVDVMVDHLKQLASKEPERVAEVVKQWVQKNVGNE